LALVVLTAVSASIRFWAGHRMDVPWIAPDETVYALLGRALWGDGASSLLGATTVGYSLVYPALIGLPLSLGEAAAGLAGAQALGAIVISATAAVVYLWGRRVVGDWWALAAAALTLAVPELAYAGFLMSEVAVYPTVTLALWAMAAVLARPSLAGQALVAAAILLALATHVRSLALLPALFLATALYAAFTRSWEPVRRQAPLLAGIGLACAATTAAFALTGSWNDVLGAYAAATGGYDLGAAGADIAWHFAGVFILVAGIPLVALAATTVECARRREREPAACALVATTFAWTACLVVEVGTFASRWVGHVALRDLLPVVPPLMLVFALWLVRGLPRPAPAIQIAAFALAVPAVLLPIKRFAIQESALDAFSLVPLWRLREATSTSTLELAYLLTVVALVAAAVFVPPRARLVLPAAVALALVSLSVLSTREIDRLTAAERTWVFDVGDPRWIDAAADGPVTYLQAATDLSAGFWKNAFWNRRVDSVAYLPNAAPVQPARATLVRLPASGILRTSSGRPLRAGLVVSPKELELVGEAVAAAPRSTDLAGLTLWRLSGAARVSSWTSGLQPNGDFAGEVGMTVYACGPGRLELILLGKQGLPVEIHADGILYARVTVAPGDVWEGSVPAPPDADGRRRCFFTVTSRGLVGSTRLAFVRG
jgi:hypothetical protein